jgi:hypothetical protein
MPCAKVRYVMTTMITGQAARNFACGKAEPNRELYRLSWILSLGAMPVSTVIPAVHCINNIMSNSNQHHEVQWPETGARGVNGTIIYFIRQFFLAAWGKWWATSYCSYAYERHYVRKCAGFVIMATKYQYQWGNVRASSLWPLNIILKPTKSPKHVNN